MPGSRCSSAAWLELLYLSLSDYVQHAHAPGAPEADAFNRALDERVRRFVELGAVVGIVADHGMNDKALPDGEPNVIFLEDELNGRFGAGVGAGDLPDHRPVRAPPRRARVVCPRLCAKRRRHPGADGGERGVARGRPGARRRPMPRERFELPLDREGDFVVLGDANTAIGASRAEHDLSGLAGHRLRSHGGLGEQPVPFILSRPLTAEYRRIAATRRLRNFDIFDFALNGVE